MKQSEYNNGDHDNAQLQRQQQPPSKLPDHLKCGEVYTWLCAGDLYAVECKLCEDRPLCPLSEFPQHMEVWHTNWEESLNGEEDEEVDSQKDEHDDQFDEDLNENQFDDNDVVNNDHNEDLYLSFTTEDSGLYEDEPQHEIEQEQPELQQNFNEEQEEILEPFEQVLIEQDNAIDTTQNNGHEDEEKIDENKQEIETTAQGRIANVVRQEQQHKQHKQYHELQQQQLIINNTIKENYKQKEHRANDCTANNTLRESGPLKQQIEETTGNFKELRENNLIEKPVNEVQCQDFESNNVKNKKNSKTIKNTRNSNKRTTKKSSRNQRVHKKKCAENSGKNKELIKLEIEALVTNDKEKTTKESLKLNEIHNENQKMDLQPYEEMSEKSLDFKEANNITERKISLRQYNKKTSYFSKYTKTKKKLNKDLIMKINEEKISENLEKSNESLDNSKNCGENSNNKRTTSLRVRIKKNRDNTQKAKEILSNEFISANDNREIISDLQENFRDILTTDTETTTNNKNHSFKKGKRIIQDISLKEKDKSSDEFSATSDNCEISYDLAENFRDILTAIEEKSQTLTNKRKATLRAKNRKTKDNTGEATANENNELWTIPDNGEFSSDLEQNFRAILTSLDKSQNSTKSRANSLTTRQRKMSKNCEFSCDLEENFRQILSKNLEKSLHLIKSKIMETKEKLNEDILAVYNKLVNVCDLKKNLFNKDTEKLHNFKIPKENKRNERKLSLRHRKVKPNESFDILKEKFTKELVKAHDKPVSSRYIETNSKQDKADTIASLNLQQHEDYSYTTTLNSFKESYSQKRKVLLRSRIRKLKENSNFEKPKPTLTLANLQIKELEELRIIKENLGSSESSCEFEKNSFVKNKNINICLPENLLENPCVGSYNTESDSSISPGSLTSSYITRDSISGYDIKTGNSSLIFNENLPTLEPVTPQSPKTEEEHFEFYEPKEKLTKHHIIELINLYKEHPRLWDQSHVEFCEPLLCRQSWQNITDKWNNYCKRKFTITDVRIRICTLCQRYLKERERLELEGELDESAKFSYYEQMQFLEQQKSLQKRSALYDQQNEKVLEIYKHYPVLWHVGCYKLRQAKERTKAFQSISMAIKLCGINLSSLAVQKRIRSLRKCYRLEKIRYLHCQVEQTKFVATFKHFEIMQFLDKHIDPFACRICGKIFENLTHYREHLETENHGSILDEDTESENENETFSNENLGNTESTLAEETSALIDNMEIAKVSLNTKHHGSILHEVTESENEYETETEKAEQISEMMDETLGTFSNENLENLESTLAEKTSAITDNMEISEVPLNTEHVLDSVAYTSINEVTLDNTCPVINEVLIYPANACEETILNSLHIEDQIIGEIMGNVTNNDNFTTQSLDNFIYSVNNCEDITLSNCIAGEILPVTLMDTEIPNLYVQNEVVIDQTMDMEIQNNSEEDNMNATQINFNENEEAKEIQTENNSSPPMLVNFEFAGYSQDLKLNTNSENIETPIYDDDQEISSAEIDVIFARLPDEDIHKMIALYRKYPQLWDPNHLDYNSRNLRRQAWCTLTAEYCKLVGRQFSWRSIHRKITDYVKYYKKLLMEQQDYEEVENKWIFYKDLAFLNDVIAVHGELQRSVHHRDNNFKIIGIYKSLPQLWNIRHIDFNKRPVKQRNIELMCNRLQEEYNLQITPERLKNRLIELRAQYRAAKKQRLKSIKNHRIYTSDFEFYEALNYLDAHIDPFVCEACQMEFKKLTDFNQHMRKEHEKKKVLRQQPLYLAEHKEGDDEQLKNVCHICGIKFTTRSNLVHHVLRHEGVKNYACTLCTKKFYSSHSLKIHIRSHTKECPYTCEKCGASFVSASKLNQHVKRHSNKKDFACDYCPKAFFTAFEKDRHVRRHLNIRDKVCPICGKSFVVGSSYYAHMMLHNDTKRFACDTCDMKFAQYAGLYKHKKRHHK